MAVNEGDARDAILLVVVGVLVAALDEFLLGFFETERAY